MRTGIRVWKDRDLGRDILITYVENHEKKQKIVEIGQKMSYHII